MLQITFIPASSEYQSEASEYERIWQEEGTLITSTLVEVSGIQIQEKTIKAIIYEGMSFSGKNEDSLMRLRASYTTNTKKATLIHELGHRLLFQINNYNGLDEHQVLNLFLFDTWLKLYGHDFAHEQVRIESSRKGHYDYERSWKWALEMSQEERARMLAEIVQ